MSPVPQVGSNTSIQNSGKLAQTTNNKKQEKIVINFPRTEQSKQQDEPAKWLRPGSYDINLFSKSTEYVGDEKRIVYTDENGNKYTSISGADLVLLNKVKSGNLFHKARYQTAIPKSEYENLLKGAGYGLNLEGDENNFYKEGHTKLDTKKFEDTRKDFKKSLQKFGFEQHPAKENVGTITVNGEKMMVIAKQNGVSLLRETSSDASSPMETMDFHNLNELKSALKNDTNNWGKYSGIQDINNYFIP